MSAIAQARPGTSKLRAIPGSERPLRAGTVRLGPVDPDQIVTLTLRVRMRSDAPPSALALAAGTRIAPLSHAQFRERYGAADTDLACIAAFAATHGLAVVESDAARRVVGLAGPAERVGRAFGVELARYRHGRTHHRGFEGQVQVPAELAAVIEHVSGLDDRQLGQPMSRPAAMPADKTALTPAQVAALYDFPAVSAAGQVIGIIEFGGGYRASDVQDYFQTMAHLPVPTVTAVSVDGAPNAAPPPLAMSGSRLHSYFGSDTSQHIHFIGNDGHVHELYAEPGSTWLDNDLTVSAGAPPAASGTALTSFWGDDGSQHVHFIGTDGHVHELYIEPKATWKHNDLTTSSNGVSPRAGSPLAAYWQPGGFQHVDFVGTDGHVHELYIGPGKGWSCNDLTAAARSTVTVAADSALFGYGGSDTSQHINFVGTDGHVHELYAEPNAGWAMNDLTVASRGALPRANSPLSSYWQTDGSQHVNFISADGHIHELYIAPGRGWEDNDLTTASKTTVMAAADSRLDSYFGPDTSQHVNFVGTDGHVHEIYANKGAGWAANDLSAAAPQAWTPAAGSPLSGYMQADEGQHVNFIGADGHVYELYLATDHAWESNDLSVGGAQAEVALDIAVAGSAAPGARIVVYFAPNTEKGWVDAFSTAIHDTANKPSVLSISWGGDESGWGNSIAAMSSVLAEAVTLGITVFSSSGDSGSETPAAVSYPASDPNVTGCGGTTVENVVGLSFDQVAWGGSGGGISNSFGLPAWQSGAGIPKSINPAGHVGRGVPDIAGNADLDTGYVLVIGGAPTLLIWNGTSSVAPLYAGLVALLNASLGGRVGYLNPTLYGLSDPAVFDDIMTGTNTGYEAGKRWDAVTGLGSVNGSELAYALMGPVGPSGSIAARAQLNDDQLDAAVIDRTGALAVCWVDRANPWSGPLQIRRAGTAPAGGHVALGHQVSDGQLNAVCVDATGTLAVNWVVGDGAWSGPLAISGAGFAPPGASVALASQVSMGQLDAMLVDGTGALSVFWVDGAGKWAGPLKVSAAGFAPPGAGVALAHQVNAGQLDAVLVDHTGTLQVFWVDGDGKWSGPLAISKPGFAPPGASVAMHYQRSLNQLDVVLVDNTGSLQVFWVGGDGGWAGPVAISAPNFAPPGASVAMEHQLGWSQLDVAVVDNTGRLAVFWVVDAGSWAGPLGISKPGYAKPGAAVALAHQVSRQQLNALVADASGALSVFYVVGDGAWAGPVAIPTALS